MNLESALSVSSTPRLVLERFVALFDFLLNEHGRGFLWSVNRLLPSEAGRSHSESLLARFRALCEQEDFAPQYFASHSDLACGSTIGPISAARTGLACVDVGNPMLSMHSCREQAGSADVAPMIAVLRRFLAGPEAP